MRVHNAVVLSVLLSSFLFLTSCESQSGFGSDNDSLNPSATLTRADDNSLTLPPGTNDENSPRQKLEGLKGLKGVNVDQLFSENIRDTDRRFDRLENVVTDFRREYESVKPEIIRLVAIEKDMQKLIELLNQDVGLPETSPQFSSLEDDPLSDPVALNQEQMASPVTPPVIETPAVPPPRTEPEQPKPQKAMAPQGTMPKKATKASPASLSGFRYGEHSNYTRLVIDGNLETSYNLDLDPSGEIIKITVPNSGWSGQASKNYGSNTLLQSYNAQSNANGETDIYVSFNKPVKVIKQGSLKNDTAPKFRIFIDIQE